MKKSIAAFVALVCGLVIICTANADTFTIHNGTTFGMPKEDVISKEAASGFNVEEDEVSELVAEKTKATFMAAGKGTVAGFDKSTVTYFFNEDNKLYAVIYELGVSGSNSVSDFDPIDSMLKEKYGEPDASIAVAAANAGNAPINYDARFYSVAAPFIPPMCSSWSVKQEDGSIVVIVHFMYQANVFGKTVTEHSIGYQSYTNDEIESGAGAALDEINKTLDDL